MEGESSNSVSVQDSLSGMSRAAKLFIRVDKEGFLIDSLAISDVVNFDCIESIVTSAKRIISLFTDVSAEEVDIIGLFYYKKRARSLRMNPVSLATTTDGFRAIAEHPSGEIPLGIEWVKKNPQTTSSALKLKAKNNVQKRSRSASPAVAETEISEKKRKLDVPAKYKTYMPTSEGIESSTTGSMTRRVVYEPVKLSNTQAIEETVRSLNDRINSAQASAEGNVPDFKKFQKPLKPTDYGTSEETGKRNPRQIKSNYHWTEDVSCEVILSYDGISERRKLKPGVSAIVQSLFKGNYSVLRPDLYQSLNNLDSKQTNQEILNSMNYSEGGKRSITYLKDAKTEIFKVLSLLCMSRARFKDLLDWMKTLQLEEGNQGKYYLSERNAVGSGLRVMYDSDEQTAAKLNSIHRARAKGKEKTKLLYPVTPLQPMVNVAKPGDKQFMIMVPGTSASTPPVTATAKSANNSNPGDTVTTVYSPIGQSVVPITMVQNQTAQPHPAWSKEVLNKVVEPPKTSLVSLLNSNTKSVATSTTTQSFKPTTRHPNILRKMGRRSVDPVPMHLFRSYKAGKDPENTNIAQFESAEKDECDQVLHVVIKQEPVEYNSEDIGGAGDIHYSSDPPDECNDAKNTLHGGNELDMGLVIKTEPLDDYGT